MEKIGQDVTRMMTVGEAAHEAQFHPNHVRRLLRTKRVVGQKWGQTWMIDRKSWRQYMKEVARHERRGPRRRTIEQNDTPIEQADSTAA